MKSILLATTLVLVSFTASAQQSPFDRAYQSCVDKNGPINNLVVHECAGEVSEKARNAITRHYKALHTQLSQDDPADAAKLETSQKAWITYRDTHCELATQHIGSPMTSYCPMTLNSARALELQEFLGD